MNRFDLTERDLRSLRIFCAAAEAGGFAAAERRLNMTKASISRHIKEVEERLGVRLCERGPAGFKLSAAGRVALELTTNALNSLERIKPEIDAVRAVISGTVSIGTVEHMLADPNCRLAEALKELRRRAPNVQAEVAVMTFGNLNQALRERRVQVAIRGMYKKERAFHYQKLFVEDHRVYVAAHASGKDQHPPLVYRPHPFVEEMLATQGFERGPEAAGLEAIAMLVESGGYAGLLPEHYVELIAPRFDLRALPDSPVFHNTICAITEASRPLSRSAELFLEILEELHASDSSLSNRHSAR
ncbi:LysR family transcriptional regulator [Pseudomonas fluorescens]|uniref:HTH-type transcriptional regulator GltC n=1 Tax=Pseudomonas fluorescens TaxID=294 RepID=A0A5E7UPE6_PSEFL|nr:LysR family transcriptional regulator [Pseudomonas fluorescens]VVQ12953.1 HTH-type transcriptional regulator GltC [Pseudomonas fluorescens]